MADKKEGPDDLLTCPSCEGDGCYEDTPGHPGDGPDHGVYLCMLCGGVGQATRAAVWEWRRDMDRGQGICPDCGAGRLQHIGGCRGDDAEIFGVQP